MKPLIVYRTRTGNTAQLAEAIAAVLDAELIAADRVQASDFQGRSLVGFGSGIYWGQLDPLVYRLAPLLPKDSRLFVFFTSGLGFKLLIGLYRSSIGNRLGKLGLRCVGLWHCRGHDRHPLMKWMGIGKGRPNAQDLASAQAFALEIKRLG
jgi:flavodoxin